MQTPEIRKSNETVPPIPLAKPEEPMSWWERASQGIFGLPEETKRAIANVPTLDLPTEKIEKAKKDSNLGGRVAQLEIDVKALRKIMEDSPKAGSFQVGALEGASNETSEQKENLFWTLRTKYIKEDGISEAEATRLATQQSNWSPEHVGDAPIKSEDLKAFRESIRRQGN